MSRHVTLVQGKMEFLLTLLTKLYTQELTNVNASAKQKGKVWRTTKQK